MATVNRIVQERPVLFKPNMQVLMKKEVVVGYARVSTDTDTYLQYGNAGFSL